MTREQFVGTWKLISAEMRPSDEGGVVIYPYGEDAAGMILYDSAGHMSAHIYQALRPAFASDDIAGGTSEEFKAAFAGMVSYFGTYDTNEDEGTITHHVEGSFFPNWEGGDQVRFYEFSGDRLFLSTPPMPFGGEIATFVITWERAS